MAEPSDRELERLVLRAVAALVAVVLAAGVTVAVSRSEGSGDAGGTTPSAGPAAIGPARGADVAAYVAARGVALEGARGRRAAVVSFERYLTEDEARGIIRLRALLVAGPGGEPAAVSGDLGAWVAAERRRARSEAEGLESLLATTDEAEFVATYREDAARYAALAAALDPAEPLVFAIVVVADAGHLRALARDPEVRLVDVADSPVVPPESRLHGLRPEETARAGQPPFRPPG